MKFTSLPMLCPTRKKDHQPWALAPISSFKMYGANQNPVNYSEGELATRIGHSIA